ncbi:MAG: hypothetical protein K2G32_09090 [Oscillospiraceae bacterium]|nr:hypothetical protein [Oscillospiraceae bacterium]
MSLPYKRAGAAKISAITTNSIPAIYFIRIIPAAVKANSVAQIKKKIITGIINFLYTSMLCAESEIIWLINGITKIIGRFLAAGIKQRTASAA